MDETNLIRQVGIAWELYSGNNNDHVLPGFLEASSEDNVQTDWGVSYLFPTKTIVDQEDAGGVALAASAGTSTSTTNASTATATRR